MKRRVSRLAALIVVFAPVIANGSEAISRRELSQATIGAYLARFVGTSSFQLMPERLTPEWAKKIYQHQMEFHNRNLQRILQIVYFGRIGSPNTIVNEAVAVDEGYECPTYEQLPLRMEGCRQAYVPAYNWRSVKDASKVRRAAEAIGLACKDSVKPFIDCSYQANVATRPIEIFNFFMADIIYSLEVDMHFDPKTGANFTVSETRLPP